MKLSDPRARASWRAFVWRARLALLDARPALRRSLLADLEAHVAEALAREAPEKSETERLEQALRRVGDPVRFLQPVLEDAPRSSAALRARRRPFALAVSALVSAVFGLGLIAFGANAAMCPQSAGLFQLGEDEYQIRLLCGASAGAPLAWPWLALACIGAGAALIWLCWRRALRAAAALLLRETSDGA